MEKGRVTVKEMSPNNGINSRKPVVGDVRAAEIRVDDVLRKSHSIEPRDPGGYSFSNIDPSAIHLFPLSVDYVSYLTIENFGDTNVERKRGTYDVTLLALIGACPISAFEVEHVKLTSYVQRLRSMLQKVPILSKAYSYTFGQRSMDYIPN